MQRAVYCTLISAVSCISCITDRGRGTRRVTCIARHGASIQRIHQLFNSVSYNSTLFPRETGGKWQVSPPHALAQSHPTRAAMVLHAAADATAAKLGQEAAPPRTRNSRTPNL